MFGAAAGLGTVFRVAKRGRTGLLEGCHVGPIGQAAMRRRATADGSFMEHRFFKKLLFKYTGGFFFFGFIEISFSTEANQSDMFEPDTDSQKEEEEPDLADDDEAAEDLPTSAVTTKVWVTSGGIHPNYHDSFFLDIKIDKKHISNLYLVHTETHFDLEHCCMYNKALRSLPISVS